MTDTTQLSDKEHMEDILRSQSVGHLALVAAGELYLVPLNYTYHEGRILFHCALQGKKLEMIRANPQVCFEVCQQAGPPREHYGEGCDDPFVSVICWGEAKIVEDLQERAEVLQAFQLRYATSDKPRTSITPTRVQSCLAVTITVTKMTGRRALSQDAQRWSWEA